MKYMWDRKIDVLIKTRRLFVVLFCASLVFFAALLAYQQRTVNFLIHEREIVPYVVRVDSLGRYETEKLRFKQLAQNIIFTQLSRFVRLWRSPFSSDDQATEFRTRQAEIYKMLSQNSQAHKFFNQEFRFKSINPQIIELRVSAIYPLGGNDWRVDWEEVWAAGDQREIKRYTSTISVTLSPPSTEKEILVNPLGFFVTNVSFGALL